MLSEKLYIKNVYCNSRNVSLHLLKESLQKKIDINFPADCNT